MTPLQKFMEFMRENHYWIGNELVDKYWELIIEEKELIDKAYSDGVQDAGQAIASDIQPTGYYQKKFTK
jgi:hypothetical protein